MAYKYEEDDQEAIARAKLYDPDYSNGYVPDLTNEEKSAVAPVKIPKAPSGDGEKFLKKPATRDDGTLASDVPSRGADYAPEDTGISNYANMVAQYRQEVADREESFAQRIDSFNKMVEDEMANNQVYDNTAVADYQPVQSGNIDVSSRRPIDLGNGQFATVRSMSFVDPNDNTETLIPTADTDNGRILSAQEAIQRYYDTGEHLGKFKTPEAATAYAIQLHDQEAQRIGENPSFSQQLQQPQVQGAIAKTSDNMTAADFIANGGDTTAKPPVTMTPQQRAKEDLGKIVRGEQGSEGGFQNLLDVLFTNKYDQANQ